MASNISLFIFACVFVATAFAFFTKDATPGLTKVRMCTCKEVEYCSYKVWKSETCKFRNLSFDFIQDGRDLEFLVNCTGFALRADHPFRKPPLCTNETSHATYLYTDEADYINTEVMDNSNQSFCFIGEMTKCLNREPCKIWDHNKQLRLNFNGCSEMHFEDKIHAMKQASSTDFKARAAELDHYDIYGRHTKDMALPPQNNGSNLYVLNMILMLASMWFI